MSTQVCPERVWKDFVTKLATLDQHRPTAPTAQIRRLHSKVRVVVKLYGDRS